MSVSIKSPTSTTGSIQLNGSDVLTIDSSGNLTAPYNFSVTGTVTQTGNATFSNSIFVGDSHEIGNEPTYENLVLRSSVGESIVYASNVAHIWKTGSTTLGNGSEKMRINSNGTVGIGNSNPMSSESPTLTLGQATVIGDVVSDQSLFGNNIYYNSGWKYYTTADYSAIRLQNQSITFHNGPSASAGSSASNMDTTDIKMKIDPSGRVTMPYQPSFKASQSGGQINSNNVSLVWSDTTSAGGHNVGNHYNTSTGVFTAPIDGIYQFNFAMLTNNAASGNTYVAVYWMLNGTFRHYAAHNHNGNWVMESGSPCFKLSANDTVSLLLALGSGHYGTYSYFSGYLVG